VTLVNKTDMKSFYDLADVHGDVIIGPDHLLIKGVPVVAPAGGSAGAERGGEELIQSLDLRVEKGQHTLITGPKCVLPRGSHVEADPIVELERLQ